MPAWWSPERHEARRGRLIARQRIVAAIRSYFEAEGFIETACGSLVASPGNETHLHGVSAELKDLAGRAMRLHLHTSPEFAMKKLLAAGETKIFELARVFRGRESGPLNSAEFTLLEWYRANAPYESVITDALNVIRLAAEAAGISELRYRDHVAEFGKPARRITVAQASLQFAGIDLLSAIGESGEADRDALASMAKRAGLSIDATDTWSDIFSRILAERIEPNLRDGVTILDEYPRPEAALARLSTRDPRVCERFEIYACGIELANGFGELTDAAEQRRRIIAAMDEKERRYGERYPIDEDFLDALRVMPPASGVALGLDRLVMLATGARSIDEVQWTPPFRFGEGIS